MVDGVVVMGSLSVGGVGCSGQGIMKLKGVVVAFVTDILVLLMAFRLKHFIL